MLRTALDLCDEVVSAPDAAAAAHATERALARQGASYVQVRLYHRPPGRLTNGSHWAAGGILVRAGRSGWAGSASSDYICFEHNPLLDVVRAGYTRYLFSDLAPHGDRRHRAYWEAFGEGGIAEGLGANAYGTDGRIASVHVGLPTCDVAPDEMEGLRLAAGIMAERVARFRPAGAPPAPAGEPLSARERDVMGYVAEGKTDWEVGAILGIAETTARFHADNARRKLGAANRTHAVARFVAAGG